MVAYSFAPQFVEAVSTLRKRQTVRADRKRHARPGEPIQLYAGMRTKYCRKLVQIDPIVLDVRHISIVLSPSASRIVLGIEINGIPLCGEEIEAFAAADGFDPDDLVDGYSTPRMGAFWLKHHPDVRVFEGVVIRWAPAA